MARMGAVRRWQDLLLLVLVAELLISQTGLGYAAAKPSTPPDLGARVTSLEATVASLQAAMASLQAAMASLQATVGNQTNEIADLNTTVASLQATIEAQALAVAGMQGTLAPFSTTGDSSQGYEVTLTKANLHIVSGLGPVSDAFPSEPFPVNGYGNLIIGYNEAWPDLEDTTGRRELGAPLQRGGSHNLVIGPNHQYESFGGIVAGYSNTISAPYASVSGGLWSTASGVLAHVSSGGFFNLADGWFATVSGGSTNTAHGAQSSVSGGTNNEANQEFTSVSGGSDNEANGLCSSVSGGNGRTAPDSDNWAAGSLLEPN